MNREQALQHIRAHERKAYETTRPARRFQHLESARYLREKFDFPLGIVKATPPPVSFGREAFSNSAADVQKEQQRKEQEFKNR